MYLFLFSGGRYIELFLNSQPGARGASPGMRQQAAAAYGAVGSPVNGAPMEGGMGMMGAATTTASMMDPYGQSVVQYPGFAAYTYAQPVATTTMAMPTQPPPPPPSTDATESSNAGAAYY